MTTIENFTRINNDLNGNPRYVVHFLQLLSESENNYKRTGLNINNAYELAIKKARTIGGKKYHNKSYGGGIVFQSYNLQTLVDKINELRANNI